MDLAACGSLDALEAVDCSFSSFSLCFKFFTEVGSVSVDLFLFLESDANVTLYTEADVTRKEVNFRADNTLEI